MRAFFVQIAILGATLAAAELILRAVDLRYLRESRYLGQPIVYRHDAELGWFPVPDSVSPFVGSRTITVRHNSLGLRDIEPDGASKPTILFLGDSFVWGYDAEAEERFTDILRQELPSHRIVNAGVAGYGTDQEYLLLQRLWRKIEPDVVVLIFCVDNDRKDNTSNSRYDSHYKPYFVRTADRALQLRGQPVPKSRHAYFADHWLVHHVWLARAMVSAALPLRHPTITVPDATEQLVGMIRDFVEARGARFVVGLQYREPRLEAFLRVTRTPFASFEDADHYPSHGRHWAPKGHAAISARLMSLFAEAGIVKPGPPPPVSRP